METREDFFIHLISSENKNEFMKNKPSAFTNVLYSPKNLMDEFEVGLQNIIFENSFDAIVIDSKKFSIYLHVEQFTEMRAFALNVTGLNYKPTKNLRGKNIHETIISLNNDIVTFLKHNEIIDNESDIIFRFDPFTNTVKFYDIKPPTNSQFISYKVKWTFSPAMMKLLGLIVESNGTITPRFSFPGKIMAPNFIYVYCDIVSPIYLGNQNANILDIIAGPNSYAKNTVGTIYKSVNKNFIESISIKLCDENGEEVAFSENVIVTLILHFKPRV